jgi:hypothetical protein
MDRFYKPFICVTLGIIVINTTIFLHYSLNNKIILIKNEDTFNNDKELSTYDKKISPINKGELTTHEELINQPLIDKFILTLERIADGIEEIKNNTNDNYCLVKTP